MTAPDVLACLDAARQHCALLEAEASLLVQRGYGGRSLESAWQACWRDLQDARRAALESIDYWTREAEKVR